MVEGKLRACAQQVSAILRLCYLRQSLKWKRQQHLKWQRYLNCPFFWLFSYFSYVHIQLSPSLHISTHSVGVEKLSTDFSE